MFKHLVIVLPGISGSVLTKDGKEVWGTSTAAIWRAVTSGVDSIRSLAIQGIDDPSLDDLGDGVQAVRLVQDLHIIPGLWKIDGYTAIVTRLKESLELEAGKNLFEFPYDWRRDNRVAARKLARSAKSWLDNWRQSSGASDAKLVLVAHSMGGLVSQYFLEVLGGWKDTRALVSFGTPYRGSLNALGYLANGFSEGIGPLKVDLTSTLASFTGVYQLLPAFECVDRGKGKLERIGEIDGVVGVDPARAKAALGFYEEIKAAAQRNGGMRVTRQAATRPIRSSALRSRPSSQRMWLAARSRSCAASRGRTIAVTAPCRAFPPRPSR
jgi:pimeloyl-ACP methyl ester carboxylesterase